MTYRDETDALGHRRILVQIIRDDFARSGRFLDDYSFLREGTDTADDKQRLRTDSWDDLRKEVLGGDLYPERQDMR